MADPANRGSRPTGCCPSRRRRCRGSRSRSRAAARRRRPCAGAHRPARRPPRAPARRRAPSPTSPLDRLEDAAAKVEQRAAEHGLAKVEADDAAGTVDELEEDRGFAAGRWAATDLLRHAVGHELAHDLPDGRPGQPAHPRHLGPADRTVVIEGLQDERGVVGARLLVGCFRRERHDRHVTFGRATACGPLLMVPATQRADLLSRALGEGLRSESGQTSVALSSLLTNCFEI